MTVAKATHRQARELLIAHLDVHAGSTVHSADLDPIEVGIVGGPAHVRAGTSYHLGRDQLILWKRPYSVYESARDRRGLDDHASAMDIGWFRVRTGKGSFDLRHFSRWLVRLCRAGDPVTMDIREVIYSPDGRVVRRWDDLGVRSSGDDSHLTHTHISEYRDADGSRMVRLVRRYLSEIGLLATPEPEEIRMFMIKAADGPARYVSDGITRRHLPNMTVVAALEEIGVKTILVARTRDIEPVAGPIDFTPAENRSLLLRLLGQDHADEEAIIAGVLAGLSARRAVDVAQALVAAGQDPAALAAALAALAADGPT